MTVRREGWRPAGSNHRQSGIAPQGASLFKDPVVVIYPAQLQSGDAPSAHRTRGQVQPVFAAHPVVPEPSAIHLEPEGHGGRALHRDHAVRHQGLDGADGPVTSDEGEIQGVEVCFIALPLARRGGQRGRQSSALNSSTDNRACLSKWDRVDRLIGRWAGTVTFKVSAGVCFWSLMWLPRSRTITQPPRRRARTTTS